VKAAKDYQVSVVICNTFYIPRSSLLDSRHGCSLAKMVLGIEHIQVFVTHLIATFGDNSAPFLYSAFL